jgi:hypothetical protein
MAPRKKTSKGKGKATEVELPGGALQTCFQVEGEPPSLSLHFSLFLLLLFLSAFFLFLFYFRFYLFFSFLSFSFSFRVVCFFLFILMQYFFCIFTVSIAIPRCSCHISRVNQCLGYVPTPAHIIDDLDDAQPSAAINQGMCVLFAP